jgi:hypothetical protein
VCLSSTAFLSHLVNTQVVHEVLIAETLLLLLNKPSDDSVEIAVGIMKEVGAFLEDMNPAIANAIFDQLRNILHEADIDKRTQYMIEVLFEVRRTKHKEHPSIKEDLDLVEEEDQITHRQTPNTRSMRRNTRRSRPRYSAKKRAVTRIGTLMHRQRTRKTKSRSSWMSKIRPTPISSTSAGPFTSLSRAAVVSKSAVTSSCASTYHRALKMNSQP